VQLSKPNQKKHVLIKILLLRELDQLVYMAEAPFLLSTWSSQLPSIFKNTTLERYMKVFKYIF